jgi:hypothetical protein
MYHVLQLTPFISKIQRYVIIRYRRIVALLMLLRGFYSTTFKINIIYNTQCTIIADIIPR